MTLLRELGAARFLERLVDLLGIPLVVKPRASGSAFGLSVVDNAASLATALITAFRYDDVAILQEFVAGPELAVAVIDSGDGPRCLDIVQIIVPEGEIYDYEHRYTSGSVNVVARPELSTGSLDECDRQALMAFSALGLRDYGRIDMIVDPGGVPYILEAAVNPGMTETSLWPIAVEASGLSLGAAWDSLVHTAVMRQI
jgi:D-alanine-D-alanine ligase